ncbi:MAG: hypothetical protein HOC23_14955 [Halieaceae bacterium]|jgi:hypothetical protein|nr:hypothetical protein [Halieaceae bacterium]
MCEDHSMASLGFTDEKVPVGSHICQIFSSDSERLDSLLKFLLSGLETKERAACFSEKSDEDEIGTFISSHNLSYEECKKNNALVKEGTTEVYFKGGVFDPDRMLDTLRNYYEESMEMGFPAARVIGEMMPEVMDIPGGDRLIEYESKVNLLLRDSPLTTVCQYDAEVFDGATIMDILKVHPQMIVRGSVVHNPFYMQPEEFLKET